VLAGEMVEQAPKYVLVRPRSGVLVIMESAYVIKKKLIRSSHVVIFNIIIHIDAVMEDTSADQEAGDCGGGH
jgi:hypothetical protein